MKKRFITCAFGALSLVLAGTAAAAGAPGAYGRLAAAQSEFQWPSAAAGKVDWEVPPGLSRPQNSEIGAKIRQLAANGHDRWHDRWHEGYCRHHDCPASP